MTASVSGLHLETGSMPSILQAGIQSARSMSQPMREQPLMASTSFRSQRIASRRSIRRAAEFLPRFRRLAAAVIQDSHGRKARFGSGNIGIARSTKLILRPARFFAPLSPIVLSLESLGWRVISGTQLWKATRANFAELIREPERFLSSLKCHAELPYPGWNPMVATGYSAVHAVDVLKRRNVAGENILFLALVAAPEGVQVFQDAHPDVKLYVASLDSHLNEHAYIVPGLGDAGDRLFGTKN